MSEWDEWCYRCHQRHRTIEAIRACARVHRQARRFAIGLLIAIAVVFVGGDIVRCHFVYGDWTCAFAKCRKVVP